MSYAFIWVKGGNREFVCVREADFKAFSSVSPTGPVSIGLVKALLRNSNPKQRNRQTCSSVVSVILFHSQCPVPGVCLL